MLLKPGGYQLRSGFGSYIGVAGGGVYGAASCFEAVLQAVSSSPEVMVIRRRALMEMFFIFRYLI
ncbi:hypothetical protein CKO27_04830 [Thiocystis violacea]|nr:hypothetical protein [Thiocystis violacea]